MDTYKQIFLSMFIENYHSLNSHHLPYLQIKLKLIFIWLEHIVFKHQINFLSHPFTARGGE